MAISSRKISGFQERTALTGDEYLMVAFNNRSYKIKASLFTSDIIKSIDQKVVTGDGKDNPITITTSDGREYKFSVKNGSKGTQGIEGQRGADGEEGNAGLPLFNNVELEDIIIDKVDGTDNEGNSLTDHELTQYALSANQGYLLNNKLKDLEEYYITQREYDDLVASKTGISQHAKYFIIEAEEEENI